MFDLNDISYFVQVVDNGGFSPAGRSLGIPKSKLSRRVAALEERLGTRLIQRSTRHFNVTEIGKAYYQHAKAMLIEAEAAQETIDTLQAKPRGIIRITCPITLLHAHIGKMLADFMRIYPEIQIHLEATNRRVDLIAEGVDIAIRVRPLPIEDSELIMRTLSDRGQCIVASPQLIKEYGLPDSPNALIDLPSLGLGEPQHSFQWHLFNTAGEDITVSHSPRLITRDMQALKAAAIAGVGIVQLPKLLVRKELHENQLIALVSDWQPKREVIHLVYPSRRGLLPSIRFLIDFLKQRYEQIEED